MTAYELNSTAKANEALAAIGGTGFGTTSIQLLKQLVVAAGVYRGSQFVGALDAFSADLAGTWSVARRLLTSYTGSLIRVRRSSDDTEQDIGYTSDGSLDTVALLTFCGAGDGFITTVYDQLDTIDLLEATAAIQPRIVNSGSVQTLGGHPSARFLGGQSLTTASAISPTGILWTGDAANTASLQRIASDGTGDSGLYQFGSWYARFRADIDGDILFDEQQAYNAPAMLEMYRNTAGDSFIAAGGVEQNVGIRSALRGGNWTLGDYLSGGGQQLTGNTVDLLFLSRFLETSERAALRAAMEL